MICTLAIILLCSQSDNFLFQLLKKPSFFSNSFIPTMPDNPFHYVANVGDIGALHQHSCGYRYTSNQIF